jgi:hypothetical protein
MCRNIRTLYNFDPPVTDDEIRDAALQFVRKLSGYNKPSRANEAAFYGAIDRIAEDVAQLMDELVTKAPKRNREVEIAKLKARSAKRFAHQAA